MRNKHLLLALAVVLLPPALASAGTLAGLTAAADCNGWNAEATIAFTSRSVMVLLVVDLSLTDGAGAELEHFHTEDWVPIPGAATVPFAYAGNWQAPLAQPAQMALVATVYDARGDVITSTSDEVLVALTCPADVTPTEVCRHPSRWWLRHRQQWPVSSLTLGSATYDDAALVRLLRTPHRGLIARRLAHQLAVAKLNVANGVTNDIADLLATADAWLSINPLTASRQHEPSGRTRRDALRMIKDLFVWNHATCRDGSQLSGDDTRDEDGGALSFDTGNAGTEFTGDLADYPESDKAETETTSLGTLKAMYR